MKQITQYLLPMGYALAVMVEMEDLTAGGLVMGVGMETNSHHCGLIQETVVAYEVVLGDGRLVRVTRTENEDLFYALPWSHGTLGFLVSIELKIIPIKPYMHLTYIPCHSLDELCELTAFLAVAPDGPDFLEVTVFSKEKAVVMCGHFADADTPQKKAKINHLNYWFKPWFYKHVETFLTRGKGDEYIPLKHYYHRHSRSIFWELEPMLPFGNHPVYRWLLGWLGAPKVSLLKLTSTKNMRRDTVKMHVVQDFILPIHELKRGLQLAHELFGIYPLLIFFMRIYHHSPYQGFLRTPENLVQGQNYGMFFDLGIYGIPPAIQKGPWNAEETIKKAEKYVRNAKGYQCLYADIFSTKNEFEQMFDHSLYQQMRKKYKAENAFPTVYDKVKGQW
jgi:delta24-sterol reductase